MDFFFASNNYWEIVVAVVIVIVSIAFYVFALDHIPRGATRYNAPPVQSVAVPGTAKEGHTAVRRCLTTATTGLIRSPGCTAEDPVPHIRTSLDVWRHAVSSFPTRDCLGVRIPSPSGPFSFRSYQDVDRDVVQIGRALVLLCGAPSNKNNNKHASSLAAEQEAIGIYSINRPEWSITALACVHQNLVSVALYDTLGPTAVEFILTDAAIVGVVTSKAYIAKLFDAVVSLTRRNTAAGSANATENSNSNIVLRAVVQMEPLNKDQIKDLKTKYGSVINFVTSTNTLFGHQQRKSKNEDDKQEEEEEEEEEEDKKEKDTNRLVIKLTDWRTCLSDAARAAVTTAAAISDIRAPQPSDVYTISYTSGTTGTPKGVVIPHSVVAAFIAGGIFNEREYGRYDEKLRWLSQALTEQDVWLSYLPLAHVMERALHELLFFAGAKIGFYAGDTQKILDDAKELRPTIFASVPRIFNRVYSRATAALADPKTPRLKKFLFEIAFAQKMKLMKKGYITRGTVWDKYVFRDAQARLGGRLRMILTGSAPIAPYILDWFRVVFGVTVVEGYGLTETFAGLCATRQDNFRANNVGVPGATAEVRLVDVDEMRYFARDNKGEICVRGPTVFRGYHNRPDLTEEVMDEDGFFHTGDIGMFNDDGTLSIIDRKKNLFKLSQGEYIAPEKLENVFVRSPFVAQIFVHGIATESTCVAVVVPDFDHLRSWAQIHAGIAPTITTDAELCGREACLTAVLNSLAEVGKAAGLKGFEIPRAIHLEADPFSVANGLLTPSFKLIRPVCKQRYQHHFTRLYAAVNALPSTHQDK